jgi:hypothetical protein
MADEEDLARIDKLLDEIQVKHFEMAGMVGEYRAMLMKLQTEPDEDAVKLARSLPGGRYQIASKYVQEQWKVLSTELSRAYGSD